MVRPGRPDRGNIPITGVRTPCILPCMFLSLLGAVTLEGRNLAAIWLVFVGMESVIAGLLLEFTVILSELLLTLSISS